MTSKARRTPSPPPTKPTPDAVVVGPPRSGCGRVELPDPLAGRDVDRADRAVVVPARLQVLPVVAVREAEEDVAGEQRLPLLLGDVCWTSTEAVSEAAL